MQYDDQNNGKDN